MAVAQSTEFDDWLGKKLTELNTDVDVFRTYIAGILDGEESPEEKASALEDVLSQIIENDISQLQSEILEMWQKLQTPEAIPQQSVSNNDEVDIKLAKLLESRVLEVPRQRQYTAEEKKIRDNILSQYSQMTDDEEDGEEKEAGGLAKNKNALTVMQAEKEKREQSKLESQRKKDKDKEDREKQRQLKEEKKEKRKTQKGERKR